MGPLRFGAMVIAVLALMPAAASASRDATDAERAAITASWPPLQAAFACPPYMQISTADESWALGVAGCIPANAGYENVPFAYLHLIGPQWVVERTEGNFGYCDDTTVPYPVLIDLLRCSKFAKDPRTYLICNSDRKLDVAHPKIKPSRCTVLRPEASLAGGVNLARIRWSRWGSKAAIGRGIEKGFHLPYAHVPVRIKAYRPRRDTCGTGTRLWTRVRATSRFGTTTARAQSCNSNSD